MNPVSRDSSEDSDDSDHKQNSLRSIMPPDRENANRWKAYVPSLYQDVFGIQEHARPRTGHSSSNTLSTSLQRFRTEFDDMKEKMSIFGESLGLCKCIALDFNSRVAQLEKRLASLEKKQGNKNQSNYSYIIKKNKHLSQRTLNDARKLQLTGTEAEMREVAGRICRNYLHGAWKTVDASDLQFRRISGGLSNFLYYVALPDDQAKVKLRDTLSHDDIHIATSMHRNSYNVEEPKKVLLRIYGQVHGERATDAIITESVIFTLLSERRLGPKLYGVFSGGRIEEYIPARSLCSHELGEPAFSMKIAEKMAAIHSMEIPLSKEPTWLWKTMGKWMKTIKEEKFDSNIKGKNEEEADIINRLRAVDFGKEVEWLKKFLANVDSPSVFCHNDLQEGNILLLEETHPEYHRYRMSNEDNTNKWSIELSNCDHKTSDSKSSNPCLYLIDFEYCAYNYRGFDIANHFQEWGFDYSNPEFPHYFENPDSRPTLVQKERFILQYLQHYHMNTEDAASPAADAVGRLLAEVDAFALASHLFWCLWSVVNARKSQITFGYWYLQHYHMNTEDAASPTADAVGRLLAEVDAFALASHLFWCLWSVVNARKSQITFGYWEYSISRLDNYIRLKEEVTKKYKIGPKKKFFQVDT